MMPYRVGLATLWILTELLITFMTRMYISLAYRMKLHSEINKNNIAMIWSYIDFTNRRHTLCPRDQTSPLSV